MKKKISLQFAKKLCPDFDLVHRKDLGKKACMHLMPDGEMCRQGNHFLCELVLFKQRSLAKEQRDKREAISASRINLLDTCARKYHLLRELYLRPEKEPVFLKVGDAFTVARARIDQGLPFELDDIRDDIPPVDLAKLRAVIRFYMEHPPYPPDSGTCEEHCQFEFEGAWYTGYADLVSKDGGTIIDWKYAAGQYAPVQVARQAAVYLHGFPSADRFIVYRMRKPNYRPKKSGETMAAFEERIFEGYMKNGPKKVITTTVIERDELEVEGVLREMRMAFEKVLPAMHQAGMPPSYGSCDLCDFSETCGQFIGSSTNEIVRVLRLRQEEGVR